MSTIKVTLDCEIDGQRLNGFPYIRRLNITENQPFSYLAITGGGDVSIPSTAIGNPSILILKTDQTIDVNINSSATAIGLLANGFIAIVGTVLSAVTTDNSSGTDANVEGVAVE